MTNGEKIRNMSDEELAKFIETTCIDNAQDTGCFSISRTCVGGNCLECIKRWLKESKESEEE